MTISRPDLAGSNLKTACSVLGAAEYAVQNGLFAFAFALSAFRLSLFAPCFSLLFLFGEIYLSP